MGHHFPDDGEGTGDPEWMEYGLTRGWSLLTQDLRIATQPAATDLLRTHGGSIFCLDSAELPVRVRAERFQQHQRAIYQHVRDQRVGFYVVAGSGRLRRKR